jgi:glycosyltransferase involved in cell wall biosynthesis
LRAIFLNRFFHPDHSATSQMLSDLAFGLAERGMVVTVITSRLRYDAPERALPARETIARVEVRRLWTSCFGRSHLILRSVDYATFYVAALWALLGIARRGDVVIAMTDPPMLSVVAGPIAKLRGAWRITWLQDIFPEVAESLGVGGKLGRALFPALRWLRNNSLRSADVNVAIGELMAERLVHLGVKRVKIRVVANWADCDGVAPVAGEANPLRSAWGLAGTFVVGYSGNLGRAHDIETMLSAIARIERDAARPPATQIRWLIIGGGNLFDDMKREAAHRNLTSLTFHPYQPRKRLSESLSAADVHIVALRPELEGLIVPSKFYGVAAAGRPTLFIGDRDGEISRLISRHACGTTIASGDGVALADAVTAMARDPEGCRAMGRRARTACETFYSKTSAIDAWQHLLGEVGRVRLMNELRRSRLRWRSNG